MRLTTARLVGEEFPSCPICTLPPTGCTPAPSPFAPSAALFLAYILAYGQLVRIVFAARMGDWATYALIAGFFVGWFIVLGLVLEMGRGLSARQLAVQGARQGASLFLYWLGYLGLLAGIAGACIVLSFG